MREQIFHNLEHDPERLVILGDQTSISARKILKAAGWLLELAEKRNLPKDHVYIISCKMRRDAILMKIACYLNNFSFSALEDGDLPVERLKSIKKTTKSNVILSNVERHASDIHSEFPSEMDIDNSTELELASVDQDTTSRYIVFTSGSTGQPKAIPIEFNKLEELIGVFLRDYDIIPADKWGQFSSSGFDLSLLDVFAPLSAGAQLATLDSWLDRLHPFNAIRRLGVTIWHSTPTALRAALQDNAASSPAMRYVFFCGEPLRQPLIAAIKGCFPSSRIFNHYGPAEATIYCTKIDVTDWREADGAVPIGQSIDKWRVYLDPADAAEVSEIMIEGQYISTGYLNADCSAFETVDATCSPSLMRFATGDLGYEKNGLLFFVSRKDDQVKVDGNRIELGEIDQVFSNISNKPCRTVLWQDSLHLFIETTERNVLQWRQEASNWLSKAKIPHIHCIPEFPRNSNSKVDKHKLIGILESQKEDRPA